MKSVEVEKMASELRVVISRLVKILRSETRSDDLLSLTELSTLALVYQKPKILPSELASIEKVTAQSMSQIISKLFKHGYIKKDTSNKDKRKVIITITADGKRFIDKNRNEKQEWLARAISEKTSQKEKDALINAIKILARLAG
jgi:DNA-binding MarR family transcriptional regulator